MARFRVGPVSFGGRRRVGFHGRLGPFGVSVGGRRKKGWGKFGGSGGSGGSGGGSYDDHYEMTPEEQLAIAKRSQIKSFEKQQLTFIFTSSRHMNRMAALLVATLVWDFGFRIVEFGYLWSLATCGFTLLTLNCLRIYALHYTKNRDRNLSLLDGAEQSNIPEDPISEDPESWHETFKLTKGKRGVNTLTLVALTTNLAWTFATEPKREVPSAIAVCILGAWILARLFIFFWEPKAEKERRAQCTCTNCRTEFRMPKNARFVTLRGEVFTPDDYCPNCGTQKHYHQK